MEQIHDRLKKARIEAGYKSAAEFSNKHDIPPNTYNNHETGVRGITIPTAKKYARLLNIDDYWLLTGKGDAKETNQPEALHDRSARNSEHESDEDLHKKACGMAEEVLREYGETSTFARINELGWQMLKVSKTLNKPINKKLAEYILTW